MNLADVAVFVEAAAVGSLAGAARKLGIAPMAASRRLASLEQVLGVRLIHRTTRSMALTGEGVAFLPHAQTMLEEEANGRAALQPATGEAVGMLRITASVPFGRKVVTPMMPAFMDAYPDLRVDLLLTDRVVDIVGEGIDLAVRIAPMRDSRLVARRIADNPRGLYASPAYLRAHGVPATAPDLVPHQCLVATGTTHWTFQRDGRSFRQRVSGRFTASSVEALHQACLGGMGIANLSIWDARGEVQSGELVPVHLEDGEPAPLGVWAVYPTRRQVPPKVRLFIQALEAHLAEP